MLPLHSLAAVLPLYLIAALLAMIVIWLYTPRLRLAPATSPAMQAAPIEPAPKSKPQPLTGRIDRISAPRTDVDALKRVGYIVVHEGRDNAIMVKQLRS